MSTHAFTSRQEAGLQLAELLVDYRDQRPVVLGVTAGGVPVALPIAVALDAPLDVLVVRRVGAPWLPEVGLGAVAEHGVLYLDPQQAYSQMDDDQLETLLALRRNEIRRRAQALRSGARLNSAEGRTVILVDDGVATGATAHAAIRSARRLNPSRVVFATPICRNSARRDLEPLCHQLVTLKDVDVLPSVDSCYEEPPARPDAELQALLGSARARFSRPEV